MDDRHDLRELPQPFRLNLAEDALALALEREGYLTAGDVIDTAKEWTVSDVDGWDPLDDPDGIGLADYDVLRDAMYDHAQVLEGGTR